MKLLTAIAFTCAFYQIKCKGLKEVFSWTKINYVWPEAIEDPKTGQSVDSLPPREDQIVLNGPLDTDERDAEYIYENNVPMGANRWHNKLFVTVPRRRFGVPSTLNFIWTNSTSNHDVPLIPYPDWEHNRLNSNNKNRFVSVYRTAIDSCDRLWFVDSAMINTLGDRILMQQPSVFVIDLKTDKIIKRYELKSTDLVHNSGVVSITVDVNPDNCEDAFAYIPDLEGYGLIVYNFKDDDSWRVNHNFFHLEPTAGDVDINGMKYQWIDGVFSAALSKINDDGYRTLYFHSLVGRHLYSVSTEILRKKELATRLHHGNDFKIVGDKGDNSHTSISNLHIPTGILFMNLVSRNAVGCWNTDKEFKPENFDIVQKDDERMIYPSDLRIDGNDLIVLTNKMPLFVYGTLNFNETNFRVWISSVEEAVKGTSCSS